MLSLLLIFHKGYSFIFLLLAMELIVVGALFYSVNRLNRERFFLFLALLVFSRVLGLTVVILLLMSYGNTHVKL